MDVILYPYHMFFFSTEDEQEQIHTASITAMLLYFDRVFLGRIAHPPEPVFPRPDVLRMKIDNLTTRFGREVLSNYQQFAEQLSCEDMADILLSSYYSRWAKFRRTIKPLIDEGVVQEVSWSECTSTMQAAAEKARDPGAPLISLAGSLLAFNFPEVLDQFETSLPQPDSREAFTHSSRLADGWELAGAYLCHLFREIDPERLQRQGIAEHSRWVHAAYCLDVFAQSLLSMGLRLPLISDHESHYAVRAMIPRLAGLSVQNNDQEDVVLRCFSRCILANFPGILPQSAEDILELREKYQDALGLFKERLQLVVQNLRYRRASQISEQDIQYEVTNQLLEPQKALERQLANLPRRLGKNLLGSGPLVSAGVSLMVSWLSGVSPALTVPIGLFVPTIAALLKTQLEESETIDQSPVAFLYKAKRHLQEKYTGIIPS